MPYPRRGKKGRLAERTKGSLYQQAKKMGIQGRSKMNKQELVRAIKKAS